MIKIQEVSTPGCAHCAEARRLLEQEIKQEYPNMDIEFVDTLSEAGQKLVRQYGIMASPGIIVNGELFSVGKLSKQKLIEKIQALQQAGS